MRLNETIKQIAEEARISVPTGLEVSEWIERYNEKFAELIVRECICQCDDENSQKYIMSHFGFTEKDWS